MAWNLLKDLPNSFSGSLLDIAGAMRTLWENTKRLNLIHQPTYYTSLITAGRTFSNLVSDIGSQTATLYVNSTVTISANLTIPSNISLVVLKGGGFSISTGVTLTISGGFSAGDYQVFAGNGYLNVVFATDSTVGVSLQWFGADGTGVADATAILQRFITRGWRVFDDGTRIYRIEDQINIPSGVALRIEGLRVLANLPLGSGHNHVFSTGSTLTASTTYAGSSRGTNNRVGDRVIYVADSTGMSVGDIITISTPTRQWPFNHENARYFGETNKIVSITPLMSGAAVELAVPLFCDYDTGAHTTLVKTYAPQRVYIKDLDIEFSPSQSGHGLDLVNLDGGSCVLENIRVAKAQVSGIGIADSFGVTVVNPSLIDCYAPGEGYGIAFSQCTDCHVKMGYGYRNRHAVDYSGNWPSHLGSVVAMNVVGYPNDGSCLGTHGPANKISYYGNTLSGGSVGIINRGPNSQIHTNQFSGHTSSSIVIASAPNQSIRNNVHRLMAAGGNTPDASDAIFIDVATGEGGEDANLYYDGNNQFVVQGNDVNPTRTFINFRDGITKLENWNIAHNDINIQGSGGRFLHSESTAGACLIKGSSYIGPNKVLALTGSYTEFSNITFDGRSTVGGMQRSEGSVHYLTGLAKSGSTRAVADTNSKNLVLESSDHMGASFLAPDGKTIRFDFGAPSNPLYCRYEFDGTSLIIKTGHASYSIRLAGGNGTQGLVLSDTLVTIALVLRATQRADFDDIIRFLGAAGIIRTDSNSKSLLLGGGADVTNANSGACVSLYGNTNGQTGALDLSAGNVAGGTINFNTSNILGAKIDESGNLSVLRAGAGYRVKEGTNAKAGVATLVSGTVTVSTTAIAAGDRVHLSRQGKDSSTAIGSLERGTITAGTSFVINALKADATVETGDLSTVYWEIMTPP